MNNLFNLEGRVALITGGAGGLGLHITQGLKEYGAQVIVADIEQKRLDTVEQEIGGATYQVDVTDNQAVKQMVETLITRFGRLDILINAVGITFNATALDFPEEQYDRIMAVNLKGPFLVCQQVGRVMVEQGYGRIVNIASIGGQVAHHPRSCVYAMSKAALIQLTRNLAVEWAGSGVLVNAVAPAYFRTPMTIPHFANPEFYQEHVIRKTPLARPGEPSELLGAILLLASDAGSYITGTTINVDGGWVTI